MKDQTPDTQREREREKREERRESWVNGITITSFAYLKSLSGTQSTKN
jgi:hypothetical protein